MIESSKYNRENYPRKCFWTQERETRVKFNPGLSANRPSNNWAQDIIVNPRVPIRIRAKSVPFCAVILLQILNSEKQDSSGEKKVSIATIVNKKV